MFKKEIEYVDFDGVRRKDTYYFHLTKAEMIEYENSRQGGVTTLIKRIIAAEDNVTIMELLKDFIMRSYGEKSPDGRRFTKSEEASVAFTQTEAYSELLMQMLSDASFASEFVTGVCSAVKADPDKKAAAEILNMAN